MLVSAICYILIALILIRTIVYYKRLIIKTQLRKFYKKSGLAHFFYLCYRKDFVYLNEYLNSSCELSQKICGIKFHFAP